MPVGTYTLLVRLPEPIEVTFGAAGLRELGPGAAAYTGSAFGPGGLSRLDRHREIVEGDREVRHWHIDHLLGQDTVELVGAWVTPDQRIECRVHRQLPGREVPVGASDCSCAGHLRVHADLDELSSALAQAHQRRADPGR